jgi:hypothetical protein
VRDRRMRVTGLGALLALALLGAGAPAALADSPEDLKAPTISGTPQAGKTLTRTNGTWKNGGSAIYVWVACTSSTSLNSCREVTPRATGTTYVLTDAEVGKRMRVYMYVSNRDGSAYKFSSATAVVTARPTPTPTSTPTQTPTSTPTQTPTSTPTQTPTSTPTETPTSTPTETGTPTVTATATSTATPPPGDEVVPIPAGPPTPIAGPPTPTGDVLGQQKSLRWIDPFPVVRIRGWLTSTGARVTLLTVRAPRGARIKVRCTGRSCPKRGYAHATVLVHLKPYERILKAGVKLEISITRPGYVGKYTSIKLRRGKAPLRRDLCLYPGARKARVCSAT